MARLWIVAHALVLQALSASALGVRRGQAAQEPAVISTRLGRDELDDIASVDCLEAKQAHGPGAPCDGSSNLASAQDSSNAPMSIATYPHWSSSRCRSGDHYFCDPDATLNDAEVANITSALTELQQAVNVTCFGADHESEVYPFAFGVAIADDWPASQADANSLSAFGTVLLQRWGMVPVYNGVDVSGGAQPLSASCPEAAAILIAIPSAREAYVSAPSCAYICHDRIAPDIIAAVREAWKDGKPTVAALDAGIAVARRKLKEASRPHEEAMTLRGKIHGWLMKVASAKDMIWLVAQRAVFAVAGVSVVTTFIHVLLL